MLEVPERAETPDVSEVQEVLEMPGVPDVPEMQEVLEASEMPITKWGGCLESD